MKPLGRIIRMLKRLDDNVFDMETSKLDGIIAPYGFEGEQAVISLLLHPESSWATRMGCIMALGMPRSIGSRSTMEVRLAIENMALNAPPEFAGFAFPLVMGSNAGRPEAIAIYNKFANGEPWQREICDKVLSGLQHALSLGVMRRTLEQKPGASPLDILHALNQAGQVVTK